MKATPEVIEAIRKDREQDGLTLYQLVAKHGLSKSTIHNLIKNMDGSKVKRASPSRKVVSTVVSVERPDLSKTDLGEAARQMICARLMLNGVKVFRPMTEDTPTDLLVLAASGRVLKCQCKYLFPTPNGSHFLPLYSMRKNGARSMSVKHIYTNNEVDFFLGYCLDNDSIYVIPFSACNGRSGLSIWVLRQPTNGPSNACSKFKDSFDGLK